MRREVDVDQTHRLGKTAEHSHWSAGLEHGELIFRLFVRVYFGCEIEFGECVLVADRAI